ncbi:hypothetical protein V8E53_004482, partial [Lactarius tabidus]
MSSLNRANTFMSLTIPEILAAVPETTFNPGQKRTRASLRNAVDALTPEQFDALVGASATKKRRLETASSLPVIDPVPHILFDRIQMVAILSKREIIDLVPRKTFTSTQIRSRSSIDDAIPSLSQETFDLLNCAADAKELHSHSVQSSPALDPPPPCVLFDRIQAVAILSKREILDVVPRKTFNFTQTRSRTSMDDAIPSLLQETFDLLHYAAAAK